FLAWLYLILLQNCNLYQWLLFVLYWRARYGTCYRLSTFSPLAIPDTPVLTTSSIGVPARAAMKPSSFSLVPASWMVYIVGVMSTTTLRKISATRLTSARCAPVAFTLISISSLSI